MSKVSVVLFYWIFIIIALIISKLAGIADDNSAMLKIIIVVTILYVGIMMIYSTSRKAQAKAQQLDKIKKQNKKRNLTSQSNNPYKSNSIGNKNKKKK